MRKVDRPSPVVGFRLAVRLRKLVLAVWLVSTAVFLPAQFIAVGATAAVRANLPAGDLPPGDELLMLVELIRPVAFPLLLASALGCLTFLAWTLLWHGGTVRWWMGAGAARVRLAEIIGHGVVWWWRYLRLAAISVVLAAALLGAIWIPIRLLVGTGGTRGDFLLLAAGALITICGLVLVYLATLRACWMLGESGRRSAVVAWFRGLGAGLRQPLHTLLSLLVWGAPAIVLVAVPVLIDVPYASVVVLLCWFCAAFCWVALFVSFAPQNPPEEWVRKMQARAASRVAAPPENSDQFRTTRIPTR